MIKEADRDDYIAEFIARHNDSNSKKRKDLSDDKES